MSWWGTIQNKDGSKSTILAGIPPNIVIIIVAIAAAVTIPFTVTIFTRLSPLVNRALYIVAAYLIGGIPFGYLAGKLIKGIDIREHGSKNVGATNVFRVVGKGAGIVVYVLDAVKGLAPVLIAKSIWPGVTPGLQWFYILVALAAILGHIFTPYLRFKGGKGVATASGAMLALAPLPLLTALLVFVFVFGLTRYVSLGSLTAALMFPIAVAVEKILRNQDPFVPVLGVAWLVFIIVVVTHKANIVRLVEGTENKINFGSKTVDTKESRNE